MDKLHVEKKVKYCNTNNEFLIVQYEYPESLKHNLKLSLKPMWAVSKENFRIEYKLLIANYPKPVKGYLNVILKK